MSHDEAIHGAADEPFEPTVQLSETPSSLRDVVRTAVFAINAAFLAFLSVVSLYAIIQRESYGSVFGAIILGPLVSFYLAFEVFAYVRKKAANERVLGGFSVAGAIILTIGLICSVIEILSSAQSEHASEILLFFAAIGVGSFYLATSGFFLLSYARYIETRAFFEESSAMPNPTK